MSPSLPSPLRRSTLTLALASVLIPALAMADDTPVPADPQTPPSSDTRHDATPSSGRHIKDLDKVVVTASPLRDAAGELSRPVEVLAGERLDEVRASSLGETVASLPGVQSPTSAPVWAGRLSAA